MKVILDLCGGSGSWSKPYQDDPTYKVIVLDLGNGHDIRYQPIPKEPIHGILCAPPCTDLAASGARWWQAKGPIALENALAIADACLRFVALCDPVWWCLENPKGRLSRYYGKPAMTFDPCDFEDAYTKKTLLWGNFNHPIKSRVEPIRVCDQGSWLQRLGGKSDRTKHLRSMTPKGFSNAFYLANP